MPQIKIDFDKFSTLELDIENTETGLLYYNINKDKLLHYTGWPIVGKVVDIDLLQSIMYEKELNIKNIQVYD